MVKPSDVFIGLRDVFGFLIPGMIFCVVLMVFGSGYSEIAVKIKGTGLETVSMLALSYCFGHVFNAIGAIVLDACYTAIQPLLKTTRRSQSIVSFGLLTDVFMMAVLGTGSDDCVSGKLLTRISFWMDYLRLTSPIATAEIERVESIEKFLRSLSVALLAALTLLTLAKPLQIAALGGLAAAAAVSFMLFVKFRLERCYRVLKYALLTSRIGQMV